MSRFDWFRARPAKPSKQLQLVELLQSAFLSRSEPWLILALPAASPSHLKNSKHVPKVGAMCRFSLNTRPSTWGCKVAKTQHPEKLWVSWSNPWSNRSNRGTSAQLFGRSPFDKSKHVRGFCITGGSLKRRLAQSIFRLVLEGRELHSRVWWSTSVTFCLENPRDA